MAQALATLTKSTPKELLQDGLTAGGGTKRALSTAALKRSKTVANLRPSNTNMDASQPALMRRASMNGGDMRGAPDGTLRVTSLRGSVTGVPSRRG